MREGINDRVPLLTKFYYDDDDDETDKDLDDNDNVSIKWWLYVFKTIFLQVILDIKTITDGLSILL